MVLSLLLNFRVEEVATDSPLYARYRRELEWFARLRAETGAGTAAEPAPGAIEIPWQAVQGDILQGYKGIEAGCLLLVRLGELAGARDFLEYLRPRLTTTDDSGAIVAGNVSLGAGLALNLGLTVHGLRTLGLADAELQLFPREFREGMAARCDLLGDVGGNHPTNWTPPAGRARSRDRPGHGGRRTDAAKH